MRVMMSVRNGAPALSDIVGSMLIDQYHVSFFSLGRGSRRIVGAARARRTPEMR